MARFYALYMRRTKNNFMKLMEHATTIRKADVTEDFNWGATITVSLLLLTFIAAILYVLVSSLNALD